MQGVHASLVRLCFLLVVCYILFNNTVQQVERRDCMKNKKALLFLKPLLILSLLSGCSANASNEGNSGALEAGETYLGIQTTDEIISVDTAEEWTITYQDEDPNTYSVVSVSNTGKQIGDYPIYNVVAKEIVGNSSPFVKKSGKQYIISEDKEGIYFIVVSEKTIEDHKKGIEESDDPHTYIKKNSIYRFVNNG